MKYPRSCHARAVGCFAVFAASLGCGGAPSQPLDSKSARADPTSAPASGRSPMRTDDGLVTVIPPAGDRWRCAPGHAALEMVVGSWVRCDRVPPRPMFHLIAKDYSVKNDAVVSAERLFVGPYENSYRRQFSEHRYVSRGPVDRGGHDAFEVVIDATSPDGPVRMREQATVIDTHVLLLTAIVARDEWASAAPIVDAWFAQARFSTLRSGSRWQTRLRRTAPARPSDAPALAAREEDLGGGERPLRWWAGGAGVRPD